MMYTVLLAALVVTCYFYGWASGKKEGHRDHCTQNTEQDKNR